MADLAQVERGYGGPEETEVTAAEVAAAVMVDT